MDGISLIYAYTEFLRKKGEDAEYYFESTIKKEAEIVLEMFNIHLNNIVRIENNDKKAKTNELVSRKEIVKVIRGIYKK